MTRPTALPFVLGLLFTAACPGTGQLPAVEAPAEPPDPDDPPIPPPVVCAPADRVCRPDAALVCSDDGTGWIVEACEEDEVCRDGGCRPPDLAIATEVLPPAQVAHPYELQLEAVGGAPPWTWSTVEAELPPGLGLSADGLLSGTPEAPGDHGLEVRVADEADAEAARELSLVVHPEPITITTPPDLGVVDEGLPATIGLEATGGVPPYGWFLVDGALPTGIAVDASGALTGTPLDPGPFDLTMRVVDNQEPPGWGEQDFALTVELRPLEIVGENIVDLLGFAVVTLPLLTIIPDVPLPYSTQLEATGGLQPYGWTELPLPPGLDLLVTQSGVPQGLVLEPDGLLDGSVTSVDEVITIAIPFTTFSLTGFFFFAEVTDAQSPADSDQALFLIPTLPLGS